MEEGETDQPNLADQWIQNPLIGVRLKPAAAGAQLHPGASGAGSKPPPPAFVKIHIRPRDPLALPKAPDVVTFAVFGELPNGSLKKITNGITWTCPDTKIATIDPAGQATSLDPGTARISAKHSETGLTDSTTMVVSAPGKGPVLQSIEIEPSNPTFRNFEPQQFSVIGKFSDNSRHDVSEPFEWTSSDPHILAFPNKSSGLATPGFQSGTVTITADDNGGFSAAIAVTVEAPTLRKIKITGPTEIRRGMSDMFSATGTFSDDSQRDVTDRVQWRSSEPSVLTLSAGGAAKGLTPGKALITATDPSDPTVKDSVMATVLGLRKITIAPDPATIKSGSPAQFTAQGLYADGLVTDVTGVVRWDSSDPDVIKIHSSKGTVLSSNPGEATITAFYPEKSQVADSRKVKVM